MNSLTTTKLVSILVMLLTSVSCSNREFVEQHKNLCKDEAGVLVLDRDRWNLLNNDLNEKDKKGLRRNKFVNPTDLAYSLYIITPLSIGDIYTKRDSIYNHSVFRRDYLIRSHDNNRPIAIILNFSYPVRTMNGYDFIMCWSLADLDYNSRIIYADS